MKVIITGSTGMVGKGVLLECLERDEVTTVLVVNRRPLIIQHEKLVELIHEDFTDVSSISDKLKGYDACFYCMGVSSVGMKEATFSKITFDTVKAFADTLYVSNPEMVFNYVSGVGTDSTESGNTMWARVKGKTENYILNKGFKDAYMFRPGAIIPEKGIQSSTAWYNWIYIITRPFFPMMRKMKNITTTIRIGDAMINSVIKPNDEKHIENPAINKLASIC